MATYRHQFVIHTADAVPKNFATNTLYSFAADVSEAEDNVDDFVTMFQAFGSLYSTFVAQNNHDVKTYDMADPEPRVPVTSRQWNLSSAPSTAPLPSELAICLSFQAVVTSGLPQARRRGRIFLGPCHTGTLDSGGRPTSSIRTTIANAAAAAKTAIEANGAGTRWCVWSQVDSLGSGIDNGWVDNEFDTQRRREQGFTARTLWS